MPKVFQKFHRQYFKNGSKKASMHDYGVRLMNNIVSVCMYSDSQNHESSCLLSDRFWCISPEPFELQKIFLPLLASLFKELSGRK